MPNHPKEVCVNCHFFSKKTLLPQNDLEYSVSADERRQLQANDFSLVADGNVVPGCQMKVWTSVHPVDKTKLTEEAITTDRKNFCFYWPYRRGMAFLAAQTLQKRAAENREAAHDRKLVIYGLWLAAFALFVQAILAVIGLVISSYKS
jgi:hypothetical protein